MEIEEDRNSDAKILSDEEVDDLSDDQFDALILGDREFSVLALKGRIRDLKEHISQGLFFRLWDFVEERMKLGLAYYRLAHIEETEEKSRKYFHKAIRAFKYAWETDYKSSECGRAILQRLIKSCQYHLTAKGTYTDSLKQEPETQSSKLVLCRWCLDHWD